ncbi:MAG: AlkA N-terminal domain-containing protein [Candidatus Nanopelagicales bacterium]
MDLDHERCYRAVVSRDARFDGSFYTAVRTTGIYCRPSCPANTAKRANVTFFRTPAAAQLDGFRACRRCRPDAVPGSAEWNARGDLVARAMRLVADGAVERVGVAGVAATLGYSERHLNRVVTEELGAGLLAVARTQRAHIARILLETTALPAAEVSWAAGFASIRSFNDTMASVYGESPTALRRRVQGAGRGVLRSSGESAGGALDGVPAGVGAHAGGAAPSAATIRVRLAAREPFDPDALLAFLGQRALPGLEVWDGLTYRRTLALPHGHATVGVHTSAGGLYADFALRDLRDLASGVARVRRLLDLDADPVAVAEALGADPLLGPLVDVRPGLRISGSVDPHEIVVRAIVGQQVSVAGARTVVGRFVTAHGERLALDDPHLTHVFPTAARLAEADPGALSMPRARGAALVGVCRALAEGSLVLDPGVDRVEVAEQLQRFAGIGPWTTAYVAMRGLGDPDVMLASDLGVRRAVAALGGDDAPRAIERAAHAWRPWRSYAVAHLWASLADGAPRGLNTAPTTGAS